MSKFTLLKREKLDEIEMLYALKKDNLYTVLEEYNGFSTICQYSSKYDTAKIITVPSDKLDPQERLQEG